MDNKALITCLTGALSLKSVGAVVPNIYLPLAAAETTLLHMNTVAPEDVFAGLFLRRLSCHRTIEAAPRSPVACDSHVGLPLDRADQ
jgi:hypothetical protein